jgi:hypothetical protein
VGNAREGNIGLLCVRRISWEGASALRKSNVASWSRRDEEDRKLIEQKEEQKTSLKVSSRTRFELLIL